jgi:predicted NBD/HSP70 family sugar kinase
MYLLFDIGGTKTRIAVAKKKSQEISKMEIIPTSSNFEQAVEQIALVSKKLSGENSTIEAAAGGLGLPLNKEKSAAIFNSSKEIFEDWVEKPFKQKLEEKLNCSVFLENDASMGALGEATFGAGKGHEIVVFYTISTGVGGAKIADGEIDESSVGFEPGWQIVDLAGSMWPESEIIPVHLGIINGRNIKKIMGKPAREVGDDEFWKKVAKTLAVGLYNSMVIWSPDIFVVGGSVAKKIPMEFVAEELRKIPSPFKQSPAIKRAELGEKCGLFGALHFLNNMDME